MELGAQLKRQRINHIVSSYHLAGSEAEAFALDLERLMNDYPLPLIELALVETLVDGWLQIPLRRGCKFLDKVHDRLQNWENQSLQHGSGAQPCFSTVSPDEFQQMTGLDPAPIFGANFSTAQPPICS